MQFAVDIANIITALMAVLAVIVAVALGREALREARRANAEAIEGNRQAAEANEKAAVANQVASEANLEAARSTAAALEANDQAEREFLFNQVEGLLSAALQLTAAADEVAAGQARGESSDRELRRAEEGFVLRIHILEELRLTAGHGEGNRELIEFAAVLGPMARARGELEIEGRSALARSIFDGSDEVTARFLADLAGRVHGHGEIEELGLQASDGRSTSEAFWEHSSIAERLKANLSVAGWKPTINESLRLILPFARLSLGWWELYLDGEGTAVGLHDRYYDPREAHPHPFAEAWLDEWPDRFARVDEDMDDLLAPETAADMLWNSFRAEFIRRFLALVTESRSRLPERAPQRPDGGA